VNEIVMKPNPTLVTLRIGTRDGVFVATYSGKGLASLEFPSERVGTRRGRVGRAGTPLPAAARRGLRALPSNLKFGASLRRWHAVTTKALKAALAGRVAKLLPPLDLSSGTALQQGVWKALLKIGAGKTRSYSEIARLIGRPKAVRAVGGACGANPIPVLVPCHRVLTVNGGLGGFSAGLKWKRLLLAREGVEVGG
jgi:O-6-methylguanine DNA methyltransferase